MNLLFIIIKYKKYAAILVLVLAVASLGYHVHTTIFENGIQQCKSDNEEAVKIRIKEMQRQYQIDVVKALDIQKNDLIDYQKSSEKKAEIVTKIQKVTEYVDREIEVPVSCDKLSADVISVFVEATNIVRGTIEEAGNTN
jgi:enoyl-[acyl-carrier-protein] reductase (NADH)